ncbi:MAG: radical SAM protein, partial [Lachnospiraceae bacterium]|nr:radical SAM protein [Lachnospiraceae bacterium]
MRDLSLYLHIPFCERKCRYCDFLSYPASEEEKEVYTQLLLLEIEKHSFFYKEHQVISVFIGGGTPSILKLNAIERLINKLKQDYTFVKEPEITIEVNPGSVTAENLHAYRRAGINRLSIGLQSADDKELKLLGRIHDYKTFCQTYEMARKAGFDNINIDIMSAIPGQTMYSYQRTLERVLLLEPEHISAYSMILE